LYWTAKRYAETRRYKPSVLEPAAYVCSTVLIDLSDKWPVRVDGTGPDRTRPDRAAGLRLPLGQPMEAVWPPPCRIAVFSYRSVPRNGQRALPIAFWSSSAQGGERSGSRGSQQEKGRKARVINFLLVMCIGRINQRATPTDNAAI